MRTSRISRETQRVVGALSPETKHATHRSLRQFAATGQPQHEATALSKTDKDDNSSELSSAPPSPNSTLGKRKRGKTGPPHSTLSAESVTIRRSPRKALKHESEDDGTSTKRKARRQPAQRVTGVNGSQTVEPPPGWERVYEITAAMRKRVLAPVDTMGCESLAEDTRPPLDRRLQTLVALMLSSQTKDTVTAVAMKRLQEGLTGGFCLQSLLDVEPQELNRLIEKVGFHNNKTKFIKAVAIILRDKFDGDIPDSIDGLVSLPGVGPKMAYLCMSAAWGRDEGIGVDVHVHRITNLWGWHKTSTPEQTRAELESWLPRERWHNINHLLVGFGQTICLPVGRRCGECDLAKEKLCPSAVAGSPVKRSVKKVVEIKLDSEATGEAVKADEAVVKEDDIAVKTEVHEQDAGNVVDIGLISKEQTAGL